MTLSHLRQWHEGNPIGWTDGGDSYTNYNLLRQSFMVGLTMHALIEREASDSDDDLASGRAHTHPEPFTEKRPRQPPRSERPHRASDPLMELLDELDPAAVSSPAAEPSDAVVAALESLSAELEVPSQGASGAVSDAPGDGIPQPVTAATSHPLPHTPMPLPIPAIEPERSAPISRSRPIRKSGPVPTAQAGSGRTSTPPPVPKAARARKSGPPPVPPAARKSGPPPLPKAARNSSPVTPPPVHSGQRPRSPSQPVPQQAPPAQGEPAPPPESLGVPQTEVAAEDSASQSGRKKRGFFRRIFNKDS